MADPLYKSVSVTAAVAAFMLLGEQGFGIMASSAAAMLVLAALIAAGVH